MLTINAHLKQSAVVGKAVLFVPLSVIYLVSPTSQDQLTGAVQGGWVHRVTVDQADQILPVMFPG